LDLSNSLGLLSTHVEEALSKRVGSTHIEATLNRYANAEARARRVDYSHHVALCLTITFFPFFLLELSSVNLAVVFKFLFDDLLNLRPEDPGADHVQERLAVRKSGMRKLAAAVRKVGIFMQLRRNSARGETNVFASNEPIRFT